VDKGSDPTWVVAKDLRVVENLYLLRRGEEEGERKSAKGGGGGGKLLFGAEATWAVGSILYLEQPTQTGRRSREELNAERSRKRKFKPTCLIYSYDSEGGSTNENEQCGSQLKKARVGPTLQSGLVARAIQIDQHRLLD